MGSWGSGDELERRLRVALEQVAGFINVGPGGLERIAAKIEETMLCPVCDGSGRVPGLVGLRCRSCAGSGRVPRSGPESST